jgi:hypothetical protein
VSLIKRHLVLRIPTSGISETPPLGLHRLATNLQRHPPEGDDNEVGCSHVQLITLHSRHTRHLSHVTHHV